MILGKEAEKNSEIKMPPSQQNIPAPDEPENQRPKYIKMKSMEKKSHFDVGNVYDPEDDSEEEHPDDGGVPNKDKEDDDISDDQWDQFWNVFIIELDLYKALTIIIPRCRY